MALQLLFVFLWSSRQPAIMCKYKQVQPKTQATKYVYLYETIVSHRATFFMSHFFLYIQVQRNRKCKSDDAFWKQSQAKLRKYAFHALFPSHQLLWVRVRELLCNIFILRDQVTFKWTQKNANKIQISTFCMPLVFLTKRVHSIWYMTQSYTFSELERVYRHEFVYFFVRADLIPTNSQSYTHEFIQCSTVLFWEVDLVTKRFIHESF